MQTRITLVACFDDSSVKLIEENLKLLDNYELCKVPLHNSNREENDTLPYHITLSAWDIDKEDFIINKMENLEFNVINADFKFAQDRDLLYLKPKNEKLIRKLQSQAYNLLPTEKFDPKKYMLHSTMNINSDYNQIKQQSNILKDIDLNLNITEIRLYEIYPAKLVKSISGGYMNIIES